MPKAKKTSDWHIDHGTYSFSADKYNSPELTIDFTKPQGITEKGETARYHYLGALRFLENKKFNSDAHNGNRFNSQPLSDGQEVITLAGVDNIRHLARSLKKRVSNSVVEANLAAIPVRLGGTGEKLPGDKYREEKGPDLFNDGHQDPNTQHVAREASRRAISIAASGGKSEITVTDENSGLTRSLTLPSEDPKAQSRVVESLLRRLDLAEKSGGKSR